MNEEKIKQILQKEINYHNNEINKHSDIFIIKGSKKQKRKMRKHFHKRYQTVKIANMLGFKYCSNCGSLK